MLRRNFLLSALLAPLVKYLPVRQETYTEKLTRITKKILREMPRTYHGICRFSHNSAASWVTSLEPLELGDFVVLGENGYVKKATEDQPGKINWEIGRIIDVPDPGKLTDMYVSPEAMDMVKNWNQT